jgi:hypothetical protein
MELFCSGYSVCQLFLLKIQLSVVVVLVLYGRLRKC